MKKTLAILLALTLVFSSITVAFAEETLPVAAQAAKDLGMLVGDQSGVTVNYLNTAPTRIQAAVMVLRLKGLEDDAKAFTGNDNFADADKAAWAKPIMAYLKANPAVGFGGVGNNSFNPAGLMDAKSYYKVMLETLGYKQTTTEVAGDFTWDNLLTFAAEKNLKTVAGVTNFTVADVATATIETLKANVKGATTTLAAKLVADKVITQEAAVKAGVAPAVADLAVESVKAASAKSIVVKFNKAVTDEDKVAASVVRGTTPITVTTTWNTEKTEATLTNASNFAEATFSVVVKADAKELAKQDITITAQKVAKIEFTSKSVAVNLAAAGSNTGGNGYVTYKVFDQYNNDITTHYLANNLTFNVGVGTATWKDGTLTIAPNTNTTLMQYQAISVIAYDTTSGISATVSLPTSTAVGTLSDFVLGSVDNLKLVDGDITSTYYIPFVAKDMSGNETKDYNVVKNGLILQTGDELVVSMNSYVSAKLVRDPADSRYAAIEVKAKNPGVGYTLTMDMPITITAMTLTGKTSSVSTTIAKAKVIHSITLLAPSATVAVNETPEIGYEAYDQHGNRVTKYSEINTHITTNGFTISEKVDGTAKLTMIAPTAKGMVTLSSVVSKTGKMSTLNINVQDVARPARLAIDNAAIVAAMETSATQAIGLVKGEDQIAVYDQYDRVMSADDITAAFTGTGVPTPNGNKVFGVFATTTSSAITLTNPTLNGPAADVTVTANGTAGSGTVLFELKNITDNTVISTVSTSLAVIQPSDIVDYTITPIANAIYTSNQADGATGNTTYLGIETAYAANPKVYGKTNAGAKVLLAGSPIVAATVGNSDFSVSTTPAASYAYDVIKVVANKFADAAKTGSDTKVTLTLIHNAKITALTTDVKSTTVAPYSVDIITEGDKLSDNIANVGVANVAAINGRYIVGYTSAGAATTAANDTRAYFKFKNKDQYGKYAQNFSQFHVTKYWDNSANAYDTTNAAGISISADGLLTIGNAGFIGSGDSFVITVITKNGLMKNIKVQF